MSQDRDAGEGAEAAAEGRSAVGGNERTVVTVVIAGEEYTIRTDAPPAYTRECAAHVDAKLAEITRGNALAEPRKAAIMAALSLTDQLFQVRAELDALRHEVARLAGSLAAEVERAREASDLASPR